MKQRRTWWCGVLMVGALVAGCADDGSDGAATTHTATSTTAGTSAPTSSPETTPAETTPSVTTVPDTIPPGTTTATTAAPSTSAAVEPTDAVPCEFAGAQTEQRFEFPNLMTSEIGADIRTGVHECYERIVVELQPGFAPTEGGLPGWLVRYADGPVTLGQTDDQFVELDGDADLLITMNAWMQTFDGDNQLVGYDGPTDIHPVGTQAIRQLVMVDNFEGQTTWAVGLDQRRDFRVFTLTAPDRLVVDIATS